MPQLRWATIRAVGARTAGGGQTDETTAYMYVRSHGEQTNHEKHHSQSDRHHSQSDLRGEPRKQSYEEKPRKQESREERRASTRTLPDY